MKKSRKIIMSVVAVILSSIIFITSASAMYVASGNFVTDYVSAYDYVCITNDDEWVYAAVDFDYNEDSTPVEFVDVSIAGSVYYYYDRHGSPAYTDYFSVSRSVRPDQTEDSDEVYAMVAYRPGYPEILIYVTITYTIYFSDESSLEYIVTYSCDVGLDSFSRNYYMNR